MDFPRPIPTITWFRLDSIEWQCSSFEEKKLGAAMGPKGIYNLTLKRTSVGEWLCVFLTPPDVRPAQARGEKNSSSD